ncbi:MAG TPA: ROK family transcriptional regulator [Clostridiales bacterium]|nr:ROK family transcriptional regulator [Clostridiales bacterium]
MRLDKQKLADYNRGCVIELISKRGPINRAEIAKQLKLSIPTIMKIADDFIDEGIIRIIGKGESTGGKRPLLYEIIEDAYYCIGLDIGRSKINTVLTNLQGKIVNKNLVNVKHLNTPGEFLEVIINEIELLIHKSNIPNEKIMGIGVGVPGIIDRKAGIVLYSSNFDWESIDLLTPLKEKFNFKIIIENSNRTMALGEKWTGVAQESDNTFCINIGHGIGAAILEKDTVYHGSSGTSGEFGHIVLQKDGPLCDCGNYGCLEALSSGNAIAKKMQKKNAKEVFDLARQGDAIAIDVIDSAIEYLGIGIAGVINLLDPEMVILSGGIMKSYDMFWGKLTENIEKYKMKNTGLDVKITIGALGEDATAIGAAVQLLKNFRNSGGQIV